jgi:hypothetical protein
LTADWSSPQESPSGTALPDPELDRALARAIRRLIADIRDRDPVPDPTTGRNVW